MPDWLLKEDMILMDVFLSVAKLQVVLHEFAAKITWMISWSRLFHLRLKICYWILFWLYRWNLMKIGEAFDQTTDEKYDTSPPKKKSSGRSRTVDGSEIPFPTTWDVYNLVNSGRNYQYVVFCGVGVDSRLDSWKLVQKNFAIEKNV